jgi:hypothetical protein
MHCSIVSRRLQNHRGDVLSSLLHTLFPFLRVIAIIAAAILLPGFWLLSRRSPDQNDYNWWQPIISPLPILSYVVLRNSATMFRDYYSAGFAWLGRCSLETFTLQYHIWMAADAKGILSLGIFDGDGSLRRDRWRELVLIGPLFFWVSWQVSSATASVVKCFLEYTPSDNLPVAVGKRKDSRMVSTRKGLTKEVGTRFGLLLGALWLLNLVSDTLPLQTV